MDVLAFVKEVTLDSEQSEEEQELQGLVAKSRSKASKCATHEDNRQQRTN